MMTRPSDGIRPLSRARRRRSRLSVRRRGTAQQMQPEPSEMNSSSAFSTSALSSAAGPKSLRITAVWEKAGSRRRRLMRGGLAGACRADDYRKRDRWPGSPRHHPRARQRAGGGAATACCRPDWRPQRGPFGRPARQRIGTAGENRHRVHEHEARHQRRRRGVIPGGLDAIPLFHHDMLLTDLIVHVGGLPDGGRRLEGSEMHFRAPEGGGETIEAFVEQARGELAAVVAGVGPPAPPR